MTKARLAYFEIVCRTKDTQLATVWLLGNYLRHACYAAEKQTGGQAIAGRLANGSDCTSEMSLEDCEPFDMSERYEVIVAKPVNRLERSTRKAPSAKRACEIAEGRNGLAIGVRMCGDHPVPEMELSHKGERVV